MIALFITPGTLSHEDEVPQHGRFNVLAKLNEVIAEAGNGSGKSWYIVNNVER